MSQQSVPVGTVWRFSAKWLARRHDCTLQGILARCGGGCCTAGKSGSYWPGRSGPEGRCVHLGPGGCRLILAARPVTCLLYPLVVNSSDTIVLHHRTVALSSICCGAHGKGPKVVEALRGGLETLIGPRGYQELRASVAAGRDYAVFVDPKIVRALEQEGVWADLNRAPEPRGL